MSMPSQWLCIGRFPPPNDGQTIATAQLTELLAPEFRFLRLNLSHGTLAAPGRFRWQRLRDMLRYMPQLRRTATLHPFPILYTLLSGSTLGHLRDCLFLLHALPAERPVVGWAHNALGHLATSPLWRRTLQQLFRRLRFLVLPGRRLAEPLFDILSEERLAIIPNLINRALLCSREEVEQKLQTLNPREGLRLLFVGHMLPEKGGWLLLEAAHRLRQSGIPVQLSYAGGWLTAEDARRFAQRVTAYGLQPYLTHHGNVTDPEMLRSLYRTHHILVFPTTYPLEAQPLVILEALNAGCAVVSTEQGTIPEVIHTGIHGFLVPPRAEDIAHAIARYWHDPSLWYAHARAARHRFESDFHPDRIRQRWLQLLAQVEKEHYSTHTGHLEDP